MKYFKYIPIDIVNGPGTRCTLFVTGCPHHCPHCYNQATWSFTGGFSFGDEQADRIISDLKDTRVRRRGLSLSGGEPMHPVNAPFSSSWCAACGRSRLSPTFGYGRATAWTSWSPPSSRSLPCSLTW